MSTDFGFIEPIFEVFLDTKDPQVCSFQYYINSGLPWVGKFIFDVILAVTPTQKTTLGVIIKNINVEFANINDIKHRVFRVGTFVTITQKATRGLHPEMSEVEYVGSDGVGRSFLKKIILLN